MRGSTQSASPVTSARSISYFPPESQTSETSPTPCSTRSRRRSPTSRSRTSPKRIALLVGSGLTEKRSVSGSTETTKTPTSVQTSKDQLNATRQLRY